MSQGNSTPISISDKAFARHLSDRENLQAIRDAGFTYLHFDRYRNTKERMSEAVIKEWAQMLDETGIQVLDSHGCHGGGIELWAEDPELRQQAHEHFIHRLEVTKRLGGNAVVYHVPCKCEYSDALRDRYLDGLARLEPHARKLGLKIAIENHYLPDIDRGIFPAAFARFDPDFLGFTLDPGHGLIAGTLDWLVDSFLDRLTILHLNENDTTSDYHWNPFTPGGVANWDHIIAGIANSPYRKPMQLEVSWREDKHDSHHEFLAAAARAAHNISARVASCRAEEAVASSANT